jgi:hypothetical protein
MCKVGIFLIGIDLYHSTSTLFQKLILHKTGSYLDLIVHIIGLMTLLLAYRGRVKRNIAGKVVLPVMIVNGFKQLLDGQFVTFVDNSTQAEDYDGDNNAAGLQFDKLRFFDNPHVNNVERLMVVKTLLFVMVMAKLAFQGDDSCVGENEWFPWQQQHQESANVVVEKSEVKKKD